MISTHERSAQLKSFTLESNIPQHRGEVYAEMSEDISYND